jgi:anti-sigma-K factor RskA
MNDDDLTADQGGPGRAVELLRRAGVVEHDPPPTVWEAIARSVRERGADVQADTGAAKVPDRPVRLADRAARRSWAGTRLLAAAAVGALLTWAGLSLVDRDPAQVVASGELAPLSDAGAQGRAEVVEVDGHQRLRVELEAAPDAGDGYLEVWLLRPDVSGMVTLGVLDGQTAEFPLPEGLDLGEFAVVDISREHMDGDPGHGGDSLVRGEVG